ncbi:MAG: hypothetical protein ABIH87_02080 [bacterium]
MVDMPIKQKHLEADRQRQEQGKTNASLKKEQIKKEQIKQQVEATGQPKLSVLDKIRRWVDPAWGIKRANELMGSPEDPEGLAETKEEVSYRVKEVTEKVKEQIKEMQEGVDYINQELQAEFDRLKQSAEKAGVDDGQTFKELEDLANQAGLDTKQKLGQIEEELDDLKITVEEPEMAPKTAIRPEMFHIESKNKATAEYQPTAVRSKAENTHNATVEPKQSENVIITKEKTQAKKLPEIKTPNPDIQPFAKVREEKAQAEPEPIIEEDEIKLPPVVVEKKSAPVAKVEKKVDKVVSKQGGENMDETLKIMAEAQFGGNDDIDNIFHAMAQAGIRPPGSPKGMERPTGKETNILHAMSEAGVNLPSGVAKEKTATATRAESKPVKIADVKDEEEAYQIMDDSDNQQTDDTKTFYGKQTESKLGRPRPEVKTDLVVEETKTDQAKTFYGKQTESKLGRPRPEVKTDEQKNKNELANKTVEKFNLISDYQKIDKSANKLLNEAKKLGPEAKATKKRVENTVKASENFVKEINSFDPSDPAESMEALKLKMENFKKAVEVYKIDVDIVKLISQAEDFKGTAIYNGIEKLHHDFYNEENVIISSQPGGASDILIDKFKRKTESLKRRIKNLKRVDEKRAEKNTSIDIDVEDSDTVVDIQKDIKTKEYATPDQEAEEDDTVVDHARKLRPGDKTTARIKIVKENKQTELEDIDTDELNIPPTNVNMDEEIYADVDEEGPGENEADLAEEIRQIDAEHTKHAEKELGLDTMVSLQTGTKMILSEIGYQGNTDNKEIHNLIQLAEQKLLKTENELSNTKKPKDLDESNELLFKKYDRNFIKEAIKFLTEKLQKQDSDSIFVRDLDKESLATADRDEYDYDTDIDETEIKSTLSKLGFTEDSNLEDLQSIKKEIEFGIKVRKGSLESPTFRDKKIQISLEIAKLTKTQKHIDKLIADMRQEKAA